MKVVTFNLGKEEVYQHIRKIFASGALNKISVNREIGDKDGFLLKAPISFISWGENIYVNIKEVTEAHTTVSIQSTSSQLSTWGKNDRNERFIAGLINDGI